ncbi:MAG: hypothetical protein IPJ74_02110 [Saprospiraceae bacterium]|nr:hypothetical protein [Saprospiraceae bacterium]
MYFEDEPHPFWDWFKENQEAYFNYPEESEETQQALSAKLLDRLHRYYCKHLYFDILINPDTEKRMFIITAKGNPDYFEWAEALFEEAPYDMNEWRFYNLVPPWVDYAHPIAFFYYNISFVIETMWFKPIHHPGDPSILAFIIYLKFYKKRHHKLPYLRKALEELLFKYLGEKCYTFDLRYFEIAQLPTRPENKGLQSFYSLPVYVHWHKTKKIKYSEN